MSMHPLLKTLTLTMAFSALAACGQRLGPEAASAELQGTLSETALAEGAPTIPRVEITAASLKANRAYSLRQGVLVVDGDVPAGTSISVGLGRIEVRGNVGAAAKLTAHLPEATQAETYQYATIIGKTVVMQDAARDVSTGLLYAHDARPAITIDGSVAATAQLSSNAGIQVGCAAGSARLSTGWGRKANVQNTCTF